jgi:hypothetical protein
VARQYPDSLPDAADRLRLGIALVDVDRLEESKKWLKDGQRALRRAEVDVEKAITDEERAEAAERRDELRQLRDTLVHKLERAEPTPEPPRRRFETQSLPGLDPAWPRPPDRSSEGSSER